MTSIQERLKREHNRLYKARLRWQWRRAGLDAPAVLMVHGFQPTKKLCTSAFHLTVESFEKLLTTMLAEGWHAMTEAELRHFVLSDERLAMSGSSPLSTLHTLRQFYLTFDDVYDTVYTEALPILRKLQIPFTVFVAKDLVDTDDICDGRPLITMEHLQELAKEPLCTIGCHGTAHVQFRTYSESEMREVCAREKQWMMDEFHTVADTFAFPFGRWQDINRWNIRYLSAYGFTYAFSALEGTLLSKDTTGIHFLPRVNVSETFVVKFLNHQFPKWKDCEGR